MKRLIEPFGTVSSEPHELRVERFALPIEEHEFEEKLSTVELRHDNVERAASDEVIVEANGAYERVDVDGGGEVKSSSQLLLPRLNQLMH